MRHLGILVICALLGGAGMVPADAAPERRRGTPAHAAQRHGPEQEDPAARSGGRARHRAQRQEARTRLAPGKEAIDHSGRPQRGRASYYGRGFEGRKMANGRRFDPNAHVAASRSLPLGTVARVENLRNDRETRVRVEDRGPYVPGRILDVTPKAADDLDMRRDGVAPVVVEPVAVPQPDGSVKPGAASADRESARQAR